MKRESNEGGLIQRAFSARLPGGSTVMFRYCLLGGDTAAPSGLYAELFHAFLVGCVVILHSLPFFALRTLINYYCRRMHAEIHRLLNVFVVTPATKSKKFDSRYHGTGRNFAGN